MNTESNDHSGRAVRRPVTIYDLAEATGLNPSTVSRALRGTGRVSASTRERVAVSARELGYHVNHAARALHSGRTSTLALIVADITNPLVFGIIRGAEQAAAARGYTLVIAESRDSGAEESNVLARLVPNVDGVLLATSRLEDLAIHRAAQSIPLTLLNREVESVTSVMPDLVSGTRELVDHLHALGHSRVAYLGGPEHLWMAPRRQKMVADRMAELGMELVSAGTGPATLDGGRAAAEAVLAADATAVIAFNDLMAIGLLRTLVNGGTAVPAELSVAGFDNIFGTDFTTPELTTVTGPLAELGAAAVDHTLAMIDGVPAPERAVPPSQLVVRESTGVCPPQRTR